MSVLPRVSVPVAREGSFVTTRSPENSIVFVHGLQGHPYKTWACPRTRIASLTTECQAGGSEGGTDGRRLRRILPRRGKLKSQEALLSDETMEVDDVDPQLAVPITEMSPVIDHPGARDTVKSSMVFWPADLLPQECPDARVLVWGYDTRVTKYLSGPVDTNSIFSHAKNLLYALGRNRPTQRPLIFVAHSLGGIVVKEVSSADVTTGYRYV